MSWRSFKSPLRIRSLLLPAGLAALVALTSGCATNPVTGRREVRLISEDREIALGVQNYAPAQQAQGGLYTLEPKLVDYVSSIGHSLAAESHRPNLPFEFVVLNSSVPNAWAMPGGKIAINRGLLTEMGSEAELAAVMSHEIVHSTARHGAKSMERGIFFQTLMTGVAVAAKDHDDGQYAVLGASLGSGLTQLKYSRDAERESDKYGVGYMRKAGYDPRGAVQLQETFLRLKDGKRGNKFSTLFSTHPPSEERVAYLRKLVAEEPAGGRTGEKEYQAQIAVLKKTEPAYEEYVDGRKDLQAKKPQSALSRADKALGIEPREGNFHALKGDALDKLGKQKDALKSFDDAVARQNNYFYFHLRRGEILKALGRSQDAKQAFTRSNQLLPTANAHYALGVMAKAGGDSKSALGHFRAAASSKSDQGRLANIEVARMTLAGDPDAYIKLSGALDRDRRLIVRIHNASPVPVRNVVVTSSAKVGSSGERAQARYSGIIKPQDTVTIRSNLGRLPKVDPKALDIRMRVTSARVAEITK